MKDCRRVGATDGGGGGAGLRALSSAHAAGRGADASASGRYTLEHVLESTLFFTRVVDSHGERKQ